LASSKPWIHTFTDVVKEIVSSPIVGASTSKGRYLIRLRRLLEKQVLRKLKTHKKMLKTILRMLRMQLKKSPSA